MKFTLKLILESALNYIQTQSNKHILMSFSHRPGIGRGMRAGRQVAPVRDEWDDENERQFLPRDEGVGRRVGPNVRVAGDRGHNNDRDVHRERRNEDRGEQAVVGRPERRGQRQDGVNERGGLFRDRPAERRERRGHENRRQRVEGDVLERELEGVGARGDRVDRQERKGIGHDVRGDRLAHGRNERDAHNDIGGRLEAGRDRYRQNIRRGRLGDYRDDRVERFVDQHDRGGGFGGRGNVRDERNINARGDRGDRFEDDRNNRRDRGGRGRGAHHGRDDPDGDDFDDRERVGRVREEGNRREKLRPLGFRFLQDLQKKMPPEIVLTLANSNVGFKEGLLQCSAKPDMLRLMLNVLAKAFTCNSTPEQLLKVYVIIKEALFFDSSMSYFLEMQGEDRVRVQQTFQQPIKDMITIMAELAVKYPTSITQFVGTK